MPAMSFSPTPEQEAIMDHLHEINPEALSADGFESCVVGICHRFNQPPVLLLDMDRCIRVLMERDEMTEEDAREFFEFNVIGAWVGEGTPAFVQGVVDLTTDDKEERLLRALNRAWDCLPSPVSVDHFRSPITWGKAENGYQKLLEVEAEYPELGISAEHDGSMNALSIMATISDVFCGKRLVALIDPDDEKTIIAWGLQNFD